MASIQVTVGPLTAELEIPNTGDVNKAAQYDIMYRIAMELFQRTALVDHQTEKLAVLSELLLAINAARDAALPAVSVTSE